MSAVDNLTDWFGKLATQDQQDVVKFLYGGKVLLKEGMYLGPRPELVQKGLHCGPIPSSMASTCPTCGRPW
jgi:hypothetical protein